MFMRYRDSLRTHKRGPRTNVELKDFKVHKNLLAAQSDDEGSTIDARAYSIPPMWVQLVDDLNRDISQIKIKITELASLSGKALLPGFADDDDQEELIASTVSEVSSLFKECERRLKEMNRSKAEGTADEVSDDDRGAPAHERARRRRLARRSAAHAPLSCACAPRRRLGPACDERASRRAARAAACARARRAAPPRPLV